MTHHHDLIRRMVAELDHYRQLVTDDRREVHPLAEEARAVLAADGPAVPEGREPASVTGEPSDEEGPSAEEVEELCEEHCFNVEGYESIECLQGLINEAIARWGRPAPVPAGEVGELVRQLGSMAANAEAADWICDAAVLDLAIKHLETLNPSQPVPPAEGEVADLAEFLRIYGDHVLDEYGDLGEHDQLTRAADLLERQAAPVPVAVSERLPGPGDWVWHCYTGVRLWQHGIYNGRQFFIGDGPESQPATHWLPVHALPLPNGEMGENSNAQPLRSRKTAPPY